MNSNDTRPDDMTPAGDDAHMRLQLRALRRDIPPVQDLWPRIAARVADGPSHVDAQTRGHVGPTGRPAGRGSGLLPWAMAASLALGFAWQLREHPDGGHAGDTGSWARRETVAMTREYQAAVRQMDAVTPGQPLVSVADLRTLERSEREIRAALRQDPQAHFLFSKLRSTYAKRLQLSRRGLDS